MSRKPNTKVRPSERTRRTNVFKERIWGDLHHEFQTCRDAAERLALGPRDDLDRVVCLEVTLLHARVLHEFLTYDEMGKRYMDDVLRRDLASPWVVEDADKNVRAAARRMTRKARLAHKHLAHLTWARPSTTNGPTGNIEWEFVEMVADVATVLAAWVRHAVSEMPDLLETSLLADHRHPLDADALLEACEKARFEFNALLEAHREQTGN